MKILFFIISICYYFLFSSSSTMLIERVEGREKLHSQDSSSVITISVVGDLMCHAPQFEYARIEKDSFNFIPVFRNVKKYLYKSDFTFGNLETVTAGISDKGYSGYPKFNTPSSYLTALKDAGFDLLVTSNNHSLDRGEKGVLKTIDEIEKRNLSYVGTYKSEADRDSIRIFNIKNLKIALLAYSYGTNGNPIPKGKEYLINLIDFKLLEEDIKVARNTGAEIIITHFHFGEEYRREPVEFQKLVVGKAFEFGADIVIGGHPHVIQPVDFFYNAGANLDTGFVAYSMGNFISNQRKQYTDAGLILSITLKKNFSANKVTLEGVEYLPTWVFKGSTQLGKEYVVLPALLFDDSTITLSKREFEKMNQAFNDTRYVIKKYTNNSKLEEAEK